MFPKHYTSKWQCLVPQILIPLLEVYFRLALIPVNYLATIFEKMRPKWGATIIIQTSTVFIPFHAPCNTTRMLKLIAVPRILTTKLRELNHCDSSFSQHQGKPVFYHKLHSTLVLVNFNYTHLFKEWPNFKATQAGLS